jgi:VWFA-related protein
MKRLGLILFVSALSCIAQQELPSAPSAPKAKPAAPSPATTPASQANSTQTPQNPADSIPPDTSSPAPTKNAPETAKPADQPTPPSTEEERPVNEGESGNPRFIVKTPEVNVIFTVTDKRGRFIRDLKKEHFTVNDNKQKVPEIRSFSSQTDLPLRVGLLIDASNSVRDQFKFEQEAAVVFLSDIVRPKTDQAFTIGFDTTPEVTQDWTSSTEKLSSGIRMIRPGGGTAFFDAVYYACRDKLAKRKDSSPVRKAMIVLSDGDDNQSRVTLNEAVEMAQRAEVIIYTISTNLAPNSDRGDRVLKELAEATGGRVFHPFKIDDVSNAFRDIQEELRAQYVLSYRPPNLVADGTYHPIEIQLAEKKYKVRARKGYYAPKQ